MNAVPQPSSLPAQPDFLPIGTRLRAMLPADLPEVLRIERQAYEFPWTQGNFASSLASGYLAECLFDAAGGALLGYYVAMMGFEEMHLLNITVAPAQQGRGFGHALLHLLRVRSQQHQARKVWLEVRVSNPRAQRLYTAFGFEVVGTRRGYYPARGGREDAIVMGLDVTA
ncbi:ribosomal protein S18-alanine N-acetyltransferase [Aquabacterium sp.]|uniref:ribosomal protein S18-alanine N-acetyltransferase n=1 Tax=Aquabacterium sp. TaxID=1872578 RepID=UPI0035AF9735